MTESYVATYNDRTAVKNVEEDLRATGIPLDKINVDYDHSRIRVTAPDMTKAEVVEILKRHKPSEMH